MTKVSNSGWSDTEKKLSHSVFDQAYARETAALVQYVRDQANSLEKLDDLWQLNDFLNARRHDLDGKYDYRYSVLIFVFARLVKEGWLSLEELSGLEKDKLAKIASLASM